MQSLTVTDDAWADVTAARLTKSWSSLSSTFAAILRGGGSNFVNAEPAMPTRAVTVMCLVQIGLLILAWMLTAKFVRLAERFDEGFPRSFDSPAALWFRSNGLLLLLIPILVAYFCAKLADTHRDIALVGEDGATLAIVSTVIIAAFSGYVVFRAMTLVFHGS